MTNSGRLWPTTATSTSAVAADLPEGPVREILVRFDRLPQGRIVPRLPLHPGRIPVDCLSHGGARRPGFKRRARSDWIAEYLARNLPKVEDPAKVNVNQAAANEIEAATRLPRARLKRWSRAANATQIFVRSGIGHVIYGVDGTKIQTAKDKIGI